MLLRLGIENNNDDRTIAWALEHPGCFAYGRDAAEAQASMPQAASEYAAWIGQHGMSWFPGTGLEIAAEETFDAYRIPRRSGGGDEQYLVESFFRYDRQPLSSDDIQRALKLLEWSRQDLLETVGGLSDERLNRTYPGERWSIHGILKHVAGAEWWYQERIGSAFPEDEDDLPPQALASLELVRAHFTSLLPQLEDVRQVVEQEGELWSPRKVCAVVA
jgi:hypothetical protein